MIPRWLEWMFGSTGTGRDFLRLFSDKAGGNLTELCHALITGSGEASGIALSQEILRRYRGMSAEEKRAFFFMLHENFDADQQAVLKAASDYLASRSQADRLQLAEAVEPPRQELLRRLNMAPNSTGQLVAMRGDLLKLLQAHPELFAVDADFKHLLSSWFNRGFLRLQCIDWNTPAHILEKLIGYETVHAIQGWDDLRRRLMADRRCFAFFHPAMPDEPLIFVEVALVVGLTSRVQLLLDDHAPVLPVDQADTAIFYSINNTQYGLRGISFGNFLIKQVLDDLHSEYAWIKRFATLSPMPNFADTLRAAVKGDLPHLNKTDINRLLQDGSTALCHRANQPTPADAVLTLLEQHAEPDEHLRDAVEMLALAYLTLPHPRHHITDSVAAFHLSNGARLENINPFADASPERLQSSFGCMVNYLYEPDQLEINHEAFVAEGRIAMSRPLAKLYKKVQALGLGSGKLAQ